MRRITNTTDVLPKNRIHSMRANSIEWAAGLFEGEGSIVFCNTSGYTFPRLSLKMCDKDVVQKFGEVVGIQRMNGPYITTQMKSNKHWRPAYEWHTAKKAEVVRILNLFLPYLGDRRAYKALNALDLIDGI